MSNKHRVKWAGDLNFVGTTPRGNSVLMDGDKQRGISPMEMLLLGTGGCACIDLVMILKKARQHVVDAWVEVDGERREEMPQYFEDMSLHFTVKGVNIDAKHVERAIKLAMDKYCSAAAQMAALADIKTSFTIIEGDRPD